MDAFGRMPLNGNTCTFRSPPLWNWSMMCAWHVSLGALSSNVAVQYFTLQATRPDSMNSRNSSHT